LTARESLDRAVQQSIVAQRAAGNEDGRFVCPACGAQAHFLSRAKGHGFSASCANGCFRVSVWGC